MKCNDGYYENLEKNISRTQFDIKCSKFVEDLPPRIMKNKPQIRKWALFNHKTIWIPKETLNKRHNLQNRKKDLQRKLPTRDSSPKHTNSLWLDIKNKYIPKTKWAKYWNGYFSKEGLQNALRYVKRCSASLIIRKTNQMSPRG